MKVYKILVFILLVITALTIICLIFPSNGISIGSLTLRFPPIEKILVRDSIPTADIIEDPIDNGVEIKEELESLKDTLAQYKMILLTKPGHFYFPDDDIHFFDKLFAKMGSAKANKRIVRVLHYGDSQIEMDRLTSNLREFFQAKFGGGGPGLVPLVQNIPSFSVSQYASGTPTLYTIYGDGARTSGGNYGLMAKCYRLNGGITFTANASSYKEASQKIKRFSNIKLLFNDRNASFKATLDDKKGPFEQTRESTINGIQLFTWKLDTPTTSFSIKMQGSADIYGIMIDDGYGGVAVDNIPLRGSSGTIFTQINDSILRTCYQLSDVGLIILQFGGNSVPGINGEKSVQNFKESVARQLQYMKRIYPQAQILYIGPSDMATRLNGNLQTYPYLPAVVKALKEAALENGAAYWDIFEVMGGKSSMIAWVQNGLAGSDYIHFTPSGANKVGKNLSNSFATLYDFYIMRKDIDKQQFDTLWNASRP